MPLTAKKSGLLLRALEFRVKGFVAGKMRAILRRYGSTTAAGGPARWNSSEATTMSSSTWAAFRWKKAWSISSTSSAVNNFYPPSVEAGWVAANDFIDIAHGSAYYDGDTTLIFAGTVVLRESLN